MRFDNEIKGNIKLFDVRDIGIFKGAWVHLPDCGTCSVIWNKNEDGYEHVSVSPKKRFNIPSWNDMCILKDIFWHENEEVYQIHPKGQTYVNIKDNCLHLWKPIGHELNELVENGVSHE